MSYYGDSRSHYTQKPTTIIQSRGSSVESRASSGRSSTDGYYTSSRTTMANAVTVVEKQRVPDNDRNAITTKINGKVKVIQHEKGIYDPAAPLSDSANSEDYRRTQERREQQRRKDEKRRA
ncbi:hypothetical protein ONS95_013737 [Cadophora gregata]|uniref:uncharacterized protein n=1 Tax=Cadophora gregata TaxID=51156 RepID=UPI0026DD4215|nr:uncharacterized protein ONS95_013737 [Cadophora gregata]KAK0113480.1 hypothetical protein ONS96_014344 [Cadophora gregata f. sp. sojae]KAK0114238.1 hypothetical protein ONS95_013737 [Cadophora gregata]